jgi:hypothetical protein
MRVSHVFDVSRWSFGIGPLAGLGVLGQSFETSGLAPSRTTLAATGGASIGVSFDLGGGFYASSETAGLLYGYSLQRGVADAHLFAAAAVRQNLGFGKHF